MTDYPQPALFIAGQWLERSGSRPVTNPATGQTLGYLPQASEADVDAAVTAARTALPLWRRTAPAERGAVIARAAAILRRDVEKIARIVALEQGKPLEQGRGEILRVADQLDWDAGEARRLYGRVIPVGDGVHRETVIEPIGVVAAFTPWNFPVSGPAKKVAAALAAGCTVVLKGAEDTPASTAAVVRAFDEAGLPAGALNLLSGEPGAISARLIADPAVRMITFTGSVPVGKHLAALAGAAMKPVLMELGGHGPVIVCADADPEAAAKAAIAAKHRNSGQICVSPTRFFVERPIYERYADAMVAAAMSLRIGDPLEPSTQMGPLANGRRLEAISALVDEARADGARVLCGGQPVSNDGWFYPLTVLADVPAHSRILHEEPFGPVALLLPFDDLGDALARANALPYGLAGYAFTSDARRIRRIGDELDCGNIAFNQFAVSSVETPFGGVKDSGFGREGGSEGLLAYTVTKTLSHRL